jgi:hypothetical protein
MFQKSLGTVIFLLFSSREIRINPGIDGAGGADSKTNVAGVGTGRYLRHIN